MRFFLDRLFLSSKANSRGDSCFVWCLLLVFFLSANFSVAASTSPGNTFNFLSVIFFFTTIPSSPSSILFISAALQPSDFFSRYKRQANQKSADTQSGSLSSSSSSSHANSHLAYGTNKISGDCSGRDDETLCDPTQGGVCRNQTCVSACFHSLKFSPRLQPCVCASEDDSFCYLCCGSSSQLCAPAHDYQIYKPNGEYWERQVCSRCRTHPNGLACDERNPRRVCHNGKCVSSICHGKPEGALCTLDQARLCVDDECRDPCKEHDPLLRMCDCDQYSEDRCELCCHDRKTKRCENAYQKYKIKNKDARMILRVGLTCRRGLTCNKYGVCAGFSIRPNAYATILASIFLRLYSRYCAV